MYFQGLYGIVYDQDAKLLNQRTIALWSGSSCSSWNGLRKVEETRMRCLRKKVKSNIQLPSLSWDTLSYAAWLLSRGPEGFKGFQRSVPDLSWMIQAVHNIWNWHLTPMFKGLTPISNSMVKKKGGGGKWQDIKINKTSKQNQVNDRMTKEAIQE